MDSPMAVEDLLDNHSGPQRSKSIPGRVSMMSSSRASKLKELRTLQSKFDSLSKQHEGTTVKLDSSLRQLRDSRSSQDKLKKEATSLRKRVQASHELLNEKDRKIQQQASRIKKLEANFSKQEVPQLKVEIQGLQETARVVTQKNELHLQQKEQELQHIKSKLVKEKEERSKLEQQLRAEQERAMSLSKESDAMQRSLRFTSEAIDENNGKGVVALLQELHQLKLQVEELREKLAAEQKHRRMVERQVTLLTTECGELLQIKQLNVKLQAQLNEERAARAHIEHEYLKKQFRTLCPLDSPSRAVAAVSSDMPLHPSLQSVALSSASTSYLRSVAATLLQPQLPPTLQPANTEDTSSTSPRQPLPGTTAPQRRSSTPPTHRDHFEKEMTRSFLEDPLYGYEAAVDSVCGLVDKDIERLRNDEGLGPIESWLLRRRLASSSRGTSPKISATQKEGGSSLFADLNTATSKEFSGHVPEQVGNSCDGAQSPALDMSTTSNFITDNINNMCNVSVSSFEQRRRPEKVVFPAKPTLGTDRFDFEQVGTVRPDTPTGHADLGGHQPKPLANTSESFQCWFESQRDGLDLSIKDWLADSRALSPSGSFSSADKSRLAKMAVDDMLDI